MKLLALFILLCLTLTAPAAELSKPLPYFFKLKTKGGVFWKDTHVERVGSMLERQDTRSVLAWAQAVGETGNPCVVRARAAVDGFGDAKGFGTVLGCRATVTDLRTGREISAIVGDFGPATHLGEGSIALAKALGIPSDPKTGGTDEARFEYRFWPGEIAKVAGEEFALIAA